MVNHKAVIDYKKKHPDVTLRHISKKFDCSYENIRQIFVRKAPEMYKAMLGARKTKNMHLCANPSCGKPIAGHRIFCNMACQSASHYKAVKCAWCGKTIQIRMSQIKYRAKIDRNEYCCSRSHRSHLTWSRTRGVRIDV